MTGASTTREDVEDAIGRLMHGPDDVAHEAAQEVSEAARALLAERDKARAECEAHKARADRYDTEAACASILQTEVERMREALSTAERRLESGALRIAELGDARAAYGLKEWAADARAALAGAPRHE